MTLAIAPLVLLWPVGALLALMDGRRPRTGWLAIAAMAGAVGLLVAVAVRTARGEVMTTVVGGWPADVGIVLRMDALGASFALVSAFVLLAALVHGVATRELGRLQPALIVFLGLGMIGLCSTGDVFNFYVFFELAMLSAYALASGGGEARRTAGAFTFAVVNLLGSFLFLIAVAALYRVTGTLEMGEVARRMTAIEPTTALLIAVTFLVAFGVKLGLFPFHFWLPGIYAASRPAIAAILAGALANIGAYGLLRFGGELLPRELDLAAPVLVGVGVLSVLYGALQALGREDAHEVLAYSAIGHAGYVLVALGIAGTIGLTAAVVFALTNALNKGLLFLAVGFRGPFVAAAIALGALSVAGVPPTSGFFGKAAVLRAAVDTGDAIAVGGLFVGSALSFVYLFVLHQREAWAPRTAGPGTGVPMRGRRTWGVALMAGAVLGLGLYPEPLLALGDAAAVAIGAGR